MTLDNSYEHKHYLENEREKPDGAYKSKEILIENKDGALPHQDHGYAWFIVLGRPHISWD